MADTLIRKVRMDCPICDKIHDVEERERMAILTVKGGKVTYRERYYLCTETDDDECEFESGSMLNENLQAIRNAQHE